MKIWDYIKDKLFNKKKALPEPKENMINKAASNSRKQAFDEALKVDVDIKPNTLDFAIDQYMASLMYQEKLGQNISPYSALIKLGALRNINSGNNGENQKRLLKEIEEGIYGENVEISEQGEKETEFYHICNDNKWANGKNYRIYLNCKKENVASLANKLIEELKDQEFYFKFNSNEVNNERSEQFVFYLENVDDMTKKMMAIDKVKNENPKLFEGAYSVNPFLKTVDGYIGYAPETPKGEYVDLKGETQYKIGASYNSLLSKALEDSFTKSTKEIAIKEMNVDLSEYKELSQIVESKFLETIYQDDNLKMKFIESVKQNLKLASERNPELDIKGIDIKTKNQEKNIVDYTPESY